ncbi:hypothetical protein JTE90_012757 [Oedothorax gibbosus]|uniref:Anaphase-promoting complex subunit 5 n=1 Tax=Oedothorax gibbosus TaxID=931172 RepID=A0AAV6W2E8_9ARAC|nr:hypothetical protein JTE90_012757 [Oedothorax gibbosus]
MVPPDPQPTVTNFVFLQNYVTAHKISLLVLIKEFCSVRQQNLENRIIKATDEVSWKHTNQQNRDFGSTIIKLIQNPDIDLQSLLNILHPSIQAIQVHPRTYQLFIDRLNNIRENGIAALLDFFSTLDSLLVEAQTPNQPVVHKSSVLGLFIRHMLLAFDKLTFSQQTKLCRKFHMYFDAAFEPYVALNRLDSSEIKGDEVEESPSEELPVLASQRQAEFFIAQQAALLQINESSALSPIELQQKIKELVKGNPELFETCFLSYMNAMRVKEYCASKEYLFHHFDRNTNVPLESKSSAPSEDFARSSRYAALNLAIMHANFGHKDRAVVALNEAIMLAQEVNDNICLQYALAWLYRLTDENKLVMIGRSIIKSAELGIWPLVSLGIQALVKEKSETTYTPFNLLYLLSKSDVQNCQHSMIDLMGSAYTLRAGLWSYYGKSAMSWLTCVLYLFLDTPDIARGGVYHISEGTCLALRNLAMAFADEGFYQQSSLVLGLARCLFPPNTVHSHIWQLADLLINFDKAIYRSKWSLAHQIQTGITIFDENETELRKAQLFLNQGNLHEADSILKKLLDCQEYKPMSPHFYVRTLLLRAQLLLKTPNSAMAISLMITCLTKCKSHHHKSLEVLATMQIAEYQLELGLHNQSAYLLESIMIFILTHGTAFDKGRCLFMFARCLAFPELQNLERTGKNSNKVLLEALELTDTALKYLKKVKAVNKMKEVLFWQANVYHHLGMKEERNNVSHRHRYLEDEFV